VTWGANDERQTSEGSLADELHIDGIPQEGEGIHRIAQGQVVRGHEEAECAGGFSQGGTTVEITGVSEEGAAGPRSTAEGGARDRHAAEAGARDSCAGEAGGRAGPRATGATSAAGGQRAGDGGPAGKGIAEGGAGKTGADGGTWETGTEGRAGAA
jgi:hypothetical protein